MATCLEIITYAMRQARVLGPGKLPRDAEAAEGLVALQSLYDQWRTGGMFGELTDKYLTSNDTAKEGYRYFLADGVTLTEPVTVTPSNGSDYGSETGEERPPRDLALYEYFDDDDAGVTARLFDRHEWVALTGLAEEDVAPLSNRNAYGLAACLATSGAFTAVFGANAEPGQAVIAVARHFLRNIMGKATTQDRPTASYF